MVPAYLPGDSVPDLSGRANAIDYYSEDSWGNTQTEDGEKVVGIDADPGKLESHRQAGRRVVFADAEDPGFWNHLRFVRRINTLSNLPQKLIIRSFERYNPSTQ
mgnify:CR=1 FL=1